ncbi:hypothetical protein SLEP1_g28376 [Rubroshorea leprosula]|uniref:Uncharacterized protein n=1 Tax=Rubroshorea leprosula TaxID=152421 RepID=A0AAV5K2U4_9ROSI|nr:hypothetical protein SLEP1_g28376 [Rubroshorea leprosula]
MAGNTRSQEQAKFDAEIRGLISNTRRDLLELQRRTKEQFKKNDKQLVAIQKESKEQFEYLSKMMLQVMGRVGVSHGDSDTPMMLAMGINNGILRGSNDNTMVRNLGPNLGCSHSNNPLESMIQFGKVDFPVFDSTDSVKGWLFQSEQFFEINNTREGFKSQIAGMYMKGEALQWLQAYMKGKIKWPS